MLEELDEKMKHNWRLRWYYKWAKLKLDISEWFYHKIYSNKEKNGYKRYKK